MKNSNRDYEETDSIKNSKREKEDEVKPSTKVETVK